jgi:hypothetical protein
VPSNGGLPRRVLSGGGFLPMREPAAAGSLDGGLRRHVRSGSGLPRRQTDGGGLSQRVPGGGGILPMRVPVGGGGLPRR